MDQAFDPLNLLILAVAVIIFLRLRSVLGTRTGNERRYDPYTPAEGAGQTRDEQSNGKIIPLPGRETELSDAANANEPEHEPVWSGIAQEGTDLAKGLEDIVAQDNEFSPQQFLEGARIAYEMIVTAFAEGDKKALKPLLSKDVFSGFEGAIDTRTEAGESLDTRFVSIDKVEMTAATLIARKASVTVRFVSDMITATLDREGRVIDGDPKQIQEVTDIWTFEREAGSTDPNWRLVATEDTA